MKNLTTKISQSTVIYIIIPAHFPYLQRSVLSIPLGARRKAKIHLTNVLIRFSKINDNTNRNITVCTLFLCAINKKKRHSYISTCVCVLQVFSYWSGRLIRSCILHTDTLYFLL